MDLPLPRFATDLVEELGPDPGITLEPREWTEEVGEEDSEQEGESQAEPEESPVELAESDVYLDPVSGKVVKLIPFLDTQTGILHYECPR